MNAVIIGRREVEDRVVSAFEAGGLRLTDQLRDRCRSTVRLQEEAVLDPSKGVGLPVNRAHQDVITVVDGPHAWLERPDEELTERVKVIDGALRLTQVYGVLTHEPPQQHAVGEARQSQSCTGTDQPCAAVLRNNTEQRDDEGVVHFWPRLVRG